MRATLLLISLALISLPAAAASHTTDRTTVAQLEQTVAANHGRSDSKIAQQLSGLELSERLSAARFAQLEDKMPGSKSRQALIVLADASEFLPLPADEVPSTPPPDSGAQAALIAKAHDYIARILPRLPNFVATRQTTRFEDTPSRDIPDPGAVRGTGRSVVYEPGGQPPSGFTPTESSIASGAQPIHRVGDSTVTVLVRDRHEFADPENAKGKKVDSPDRVMNTAGEFGPILVTWLVDSMKGTVTWSHWEKAAQGTAAVFGYTVPRTASHYTVIYPGGMHRKQYVPAYHGEVAVNPADGSIMRLTMVADMEPGDLVARSNIAVEYAPVQIGGATYTCPVKSVALSRSRYIPQDSADAPGGDLTPLGPMETQVNDVTFSQYHLFRAEMRVLPADAP